MTEIKQPGRRNSKQAKSARKALDDENMGQFVTRLDKSLRAQFSLSVKFQKTSMNKAVVEFINGYVKKHYGDAIKGVENLEKQAERREK